MRSADAWYAQQFGRFELPPRWHRLLHPRARSTPSTYLSYIIVMAKGSLGMLFFRLPFLLKRARNESFQR